MYKLNLQIQTSPILGNLYSTGLIEVISNGQCEGRDVLSGLCCGKAMATYTKPQKNEKGDRIAGERER